MCPPSPLALADVTERCSHLKKVTSLLKRYPDARPLITGWIQARWQYSAREAQLMMHDAERQRDKQRPKQARVRRNTDSELSRQRREAVDAITLEYAESREGLVRDVRRATGSKAQQSEDLLHEALVRLHRKYAPIGSGLGEDHSPDRAAQDYGRALLLRAVKRLYIDQLRRAARELPLNSAVSTALDHRVFQETLAAERAADTASLADRILDSLHARLLSRLTKGDRRTLVLLEEIARVFEQDQTPASIWCFCDAYLVAKHRCPAHEWVTAHICMRLDAAPNAVYQRRSRLTAKWEAAKVSVNPCSHVGNDPTRADSDNRPRSRFAAASPGFPSVCRRLAAAAASRSQLEVDRR